MKRLAVVGALLVLAAAGAGVLLIYRAHAERNIRGSSTVEFVPTHPAPPPPPQPHAPEISWSMFGREPSRTAAATGPRPPFRRVWTAGVKSLIEFPPVAGFGRVYYATGAGRVYAVSARTGIRAWIFDAHRGSAASPALGQDGTLYASFLNAFPSHAKIADDGQVIALSARSGRVRWRAHVGASETSPLLADGRVFVGGWDGAVVALAARTGRRLWSFQTGGAVKGGLAAAGGVVFAGSYDGHLYALRAASGKPVWTASAEGTLFGHGRFYATPTVAYDRVYVGSTDGNVYSFGATSGRLRWRYHTGSYVYGSAAVSAGLVFVGSYDHSFYAFDAATGDVRWRFLADGKISGSATVIGGAVYFATLENRSYALDARTGRLLWSFPHGRYAPAVYDGRHVVLVGYGGLYAFRPLRR